MPVRTGERRLPDLAEREETRIQQEWIVIVLDNPVNTWDEVILILQKATGCSLEEAVGPTGGPLTLGVLDIVADHALDVTVTHTAWGDGRTGPSIDSRTIVPRRA